MAEAYTVFANGGMRMPPVFVRSVRNQDVGQMDVPDRAASANVLDPRVVSFAVFLFPAGKGINMGLVDGRLVGGRMSRKIVFHLRGGIFVSAGSSLKLAVAQSRDRSRAAPR